MIRPKPCRLLALGCLLACGTALSARDLSVTVRDGDLDIPLDGAEIALPDGSRVRCDRQGRARLSLPDGRDALLRVSYPGYETYRLFSPAEGNAAVTVSMRMGAMRENRELVIEADRDAGGAGAQTGRSVSVSGKALSRTAEIGAIEDVMSSVKLLPGVGYTNGFNALPSIRGGEPGDLTAVYDGFYVENPYFWGGAFSIFDPRAVEKARIYHGIFSARYGHTTSGLLELTSRQASRFAPEFEIGMSTSTTNVSLAYPLGGRGGFMAMGKVTYYDPIFWLAKALSYAVESLEPVRAFETPPYIRTMALSADYDLAPALSLKVNGFVGADGLGLTYHNVMDEPADAGDPSAGTGEDNRADFSFDYFNIKSFLTAHVRWAPAPALLLAATLGAGYSWGSADGDIEYDQKLKYAAGFYEQYKFLETYFKTRTDAWKDAVIFPNNHEWYQVTQKTRIKRNEARFNAQGRVDLDWAAGKGFIVSGGLQELWTGYRSDPATGGMMIDAKASSLAAALGINLPILDFPGYISFPVTTTLDSRNDAFNSGAYALAEWASPGRRVAAELGLRLDHFYFAGRDFRVNALPAANPRLNIDLVLLRDRGELDSLGLTAGTGLFTSMTDNIYVMQGMSNADGAAITMKQNRSWSSLLGARIEFLDRWMFNIESYYKYGFDRAYQLQITDRDTGKTTTDYYFDGESRIAGFDLMLQRTAGRFIDGWISYTFTYARYRDPSRVKDGALLHDGEWRYPAFHRFHNLNLVLNIKPSPRWALTGILGYASGAPRPEPGAITSYPVMIMPNGLRDPASAYLIQKYKRTQEYSDTRRDGYSLSLDLKFSRLLLHKTGKARGEIYVAVENCLFFIESRERNVSFNQYTGKEDEGSETASYQAPIPIPSFGFTYSY